MTSGNGTALVLYRGGHKSPGIAPEIRARVVGLTHELFSRLPGDLCPPLYISRCLFTKLIKTSK